MNHFVQSEADQRGGVRVPSRRMREAGVFAAVFLIAVLLLGYHPYAEDGGIYAAAVSARVNPLLFPHDHAWVTAHTRFALFIPMLAAVARRAHMGVNLLLFFVFLAGLAASLIGAMHLARTCFPKQTWPWMAALTFAVGAGLPVAGTGLYAADPYSTARSLTSPLLLFALSFALRRRWMPCIGCWLVAACMHPLMAIWGALPLLLAAAFTLKRSQLGVAALAGAVLASAAVIAWHAPAESAAAREAAITRGYWFPAEWRWFEWIGAAAPCLLWWMTHLKSFRKFASLLRLSRVCIATTAVAVFVSICFVRQQAGTLAMSRLQPLRSLHLVFLAFFAVGGAALQAFTQQKAQRVGTVGGLALIGCCAFAMQRSLYPHTPHIEWPGTEPSNGWEAAFVWCRRNTARDALVALDANYINAATEDGHGFRALALRSAVPDNVKDAGIASVLPELAPTWHSGVAATRGLAWASDEERRRRLEPFGVTWIVLPSAAGSAFVCPYQNASAKVCRLPRN